MIKALDQQIGEKRLAEMMTAVELEVDREEFSFQSRFERQVWLELEAEFEHRCLREGRSWVAAA